MEETARVERLLAELLESGREPEELCNGDAALAATLRRRLDQVRALDRELDGLFPSEGGAERAAPPELPRVDGYEIEQVLGRGGMGVVYRARQRSLDRVVALKMVLHGAFAAPEERARLRREAQAIAGLEHPNVVRVYEVGESAGLPYFTMEHVAGGSLGQQLRGAPLPPERAAELVAVLADAIDYAHRGGLIHRDLKPSNVLLAADGTPKIGDFGLARRVEGGASGTRSAVGLGTPSYMAPEQARGDAEAGPAADVWALGAILYETLTGRPPFVGDTPGETLRQVVEEEPARPARLNTRVPRDLETICLACLRKEPRRRYPSARALADELRRFLRGEPIAARRAGAVERAAKWARRRPGHAAAIAIATLFVLALAGGAGWLGSTRAATIAAASEDLDAVERHQRAAAWTEAHGALERAKVRLAGLGAPALRDRIARCEQALALVARLAAIKLARPGAVRQDFAVAASAREYEETFAEFGLARAGDAPEAVAARIAGCAVRAAAIEAVDDWATCENEVEKRVWLLEVARRADPDPTWRDRMRQPRSWVDPAALRELASSVSIEREPPGLLLILAVLLSHADEDAIGFTRRVQFAHPGDFWANFLLAELLDEALDADAVGYYRAALSIEPEAVAAHVNLGIALAHQGRREEAVPSWMRALELDPASVMAHHALSVEASNAGDVEAAARWSGETVRLAPDYGHGRGIHGSALLRLGRFDEARLHLESAVELLPEGDGARAVAQQQLVILDGLQRLAPRLAELEAGRELRLATAEWIELAEHALVARRWRAALAAYEGAFAADPSLTTPDPLKGTRYNAACAALRAAAGESDGAAAAALRGKAHGWLAGDLAALVALADAVPAAHAALLAALDYWFTDADLALARDAAIEALPEAERAAWSTFWQAAAAQRTRLRGGG